MIKVAQGIRDNARTSPGSDAQDPRPSPVVRTLNVGTPTGMSREVADLMKRKNIQILCLQETRWKGEKAKEIGEGVKLFYKGNDGKRNGVGIAVSEGLKDSVSAVRRINDRIITVRLDMKDGCWTIISVYAPQTGCSEEEKDEFYMTLDDVIRSVPEGDFLTVAVHRQAFKTVKDVEVLPGEDVTTQHKPLVADLSITLPPKQKVKTDPRIRW
ncbi:hypothetical protein Q1695_003842 [Nippostrongylus brasiliensis]|nr:hypothetical protein Q1695_003842 [Nippostrongylus brasiliensis]